MRDTTTSAFIALGVILKRLARDNGKEIYASATKFAEYIPKAINQNGWFHESSVRQSITAISEMLESTSLNAWFERYTFKQQDPKRVGVLMAGNIPLVGFHDFLCVLLSGNTFVGKLSSKDDRLLPLLAEVLIEIEPELAERIEFTDGLLNNIDAIIATGSDNTSRHIEYYFGKYPNIIRRNRNAVAVLDGTESEENLVDLGKDIFDYYGLGCRSVSKLYIPKSYDLDLVFKGLYPYQDIVNQKKYGNNYDYYKAIYIMDKADLIENGFILLKEDELIASPVALLFYEYYEERSELEDKLTSVSNEIQCVVSNKSIASLSTVPFGQAQSPAIDDYADGVDTMAFLTSI